MTCKQTQELISAYLDRQLTSADTSELRLHLETCAACRAEERSVLKLKEALRSVKMPSIPRDLLASIEAETVFKPRWWEAGLFERRWAPVALSVLVGLGAWLFIRYKIPLQARSTTLARSTLVSTSPVVAMHRDQEPDLSEKVH